LAFKPKTNDIREAPSRVLLEALIAAGANVQAYDPEAQAETRRVYGDKPGLSLCDTQDETLAGANALCVVTEWKNFWSPDFDDLKNKLLDTVIFDGRNLYQPAQLKAKNIRYYCIGRTQ
jgi:UDPglucose 6-dehydrogenase